MDHHCRLTIFVVAGFIRTPRRNCYIRVRCYHRSDATTRVHSSSLSGSRLNRSVFYRPIYIAVRYASLKLPFLAVSRLELSSWPPSSVCHQHKFGVKTRVSYFSNVCLCPFKNKVLGRASFYDSLTHSHLRTHISEAEAEAH